MSDLRRSLAGAVLLAAIPLLARAAAPVPHLQYVLEDDAGAVLDSALADRPVNPASVLKVATTLWALETLGPEHRFRTRFAHTGRLDADSGVLEGDLIVHGGGDIDFQAENAWLVARALNDLGLREVTGDLRVDGSFWVGWEGGSEKREPDARRRTAEMARRLRNLLDPARWTADERKTIERCAERRGLSVEATGVVVRGAPRPLEGAVDETPLLVHVSNPLVQTLKRFNAYSNNDIERLGASLGAAAELERMLRERLGAGPAAVRVETLSGLGVNRLTPRLVVRLLRALDAECAKSGLSLGDVLPVAGCDPGTLRLFRKLRRGKLRGALVGKTGSLNKTDGGVAAFAGRVETAEGPRWFCVAVPRAGGRLSEARAAEEAWLVERLSRSGGAVPAACPDLPPFSDEQAAIELPAS